MNEFAEINVDNFACGGGASEGIENALGKPVDYAINHNAKALAVHKANHPNTVHLQEDMQNLDPRVVGPGRNIGLAWFSPDCTYFSAARGGKPFRDVNRSRRVRGLPWTVIHWAKLRRPRIIMLENVVEMKDWGPLLADGTRCKVRRGMTFRKWHRQWENLGYQIDMRELVACDYGVPTSRKRLFVIARCDGKEIVFPERSHGPGALPYRTAAECIDWSIPCPSIFERSKPLADATLRRIARGIMRYVVNNPKPFIVSVAHGAVSPLFTPLTHHGDSRTYSPIDPFPTITGAHRGEIALIAPTLIQTGYGERDGQAPRTLDLHKPLGTVVGGGQKHALVAAFLARHYGGHENDGAPMQVPLFTITTQDHHALVSSHVVKLRGDNIGQAIDEPLQTLSAQGTHFGEVRAFLLKYYGTDQNPNLDRPLDTITSKDRFGLVVVRGETYRIADIGMRMLQPRELARATSFKDSYILDPIYNGKPLTKTDQVWMIGNAVPPDMAETLVRHNMVEQQAAEVA
jgi:DNA (cytosine-5)-methyltransferase 1